jgi:hypothetical protein
MPDGGLKQRGPAARAAPASGEGLHSDSDGDGGGGSSLASADQGSIGEPCAKPGRIRLGVGLNAAESWLQRAFPFARCFSAPFSL